ncbi:type IV toxin-antitoxin system AbiEi family antitoxin domain-containing protein [Gordonia sp. CPCC 206044]|uniref:DUF559 domain-containing protein n=1 Tax=Gordonia sp. CPCC 206044 TaxID=3140793 RepID=UPI003AF3CB14
MHLLGVFSWAELINMGCRRAQIRALVKTGALKRLRHGWYATEGADTKVVEAVRRGGVLSCASALRQHGVWVPESAATSIHVRGNQHANRTRNDFCQQFGRPEPEVGAIDQIPIAVRHASRCLTPEDFVVVCDSILFQRKMEKADLRGQLSSAPAAVRQLLDWCDGHAESGTESMVRFRLRSRRISAKVQVEIDGVGRVDLLVGDRLIVEIDGEEFHRTAEQFEEDRRRDRVAAELGYLTIRLTYRAVVDQWVEVEEQIVSIVRSGRHRRPRRRGGVHQLPQGESLEG